MFTLRLYHGRHDPEEAMNDWGFEGPSINGIEYITVTYLHTIRVVFASSEAADKARKLTGWQVWDTDTLGILFKDDMVHTKKDGTDSYFGDFALIPERPEPVEPTKVTDTTEFVFDE